MDREDRNVGNFLIKKINSLNLLLRFRQQWRLKQKIRMKMKTMITFKKIKTFWERGKPTDRRQRRNICPIIQLTQRRFTNQSPPFMASSQFGCKDFIPNICRIVHTWMLFFSHICVSLSTTVHETSFCQGRIMVWLLGDCLNDIGRLRFFSKQSLVAFKFGFVGKKFRYLMRK